MDFLKYFRKSMSVGPQTRPNASTIWHLNEPKLFKAHKSQEDTEKTDDLRRLHHKI